MEKERALVTGGAGFIGSHVTDELIAMGMDAVVLDDLSGGFKANVNPEAEFVEGSINDEELIKSLFKKCNFTYVYHLAAYAAEGLSHFIKKFNYENNLIGSVHLLNASVNHEIKCFIFTSSIAVYGANQLPMTEDLIPQPEDSYGVAKLSVEQELKISKEIFDLDYVIFRPHNVYGERQNIGDKYRNVIGIFMNQIMQNKPLTVFGDGEQTRAFTYVKDVAPIIAKAPLVREAYGEVFNVGSDQPFTINHLAKKVGEAMGSKVNIRYLPERSEVKHAYASHGKAEKVFSYCSEYSLEEGLKRMAAWAKEAGTKKSNTFENIEIMKNLPSSWLG
ncbi:MAG: NAD-dependent epimerase/dehydratase family protein [Candidatus Hodarchaeota archaeon]